MVVVMVLVMMVMGIVMMVMVAAQGAQVKNPLQGSVLQSSPAELGGLLCCRGHSGAQPGRRASRRSERRPKLRSSPASTAAGPLRSHRPWVLANQHAALGAQVLEGSEPLLYLL